MEYHLFINGVQSGPIEEARILQGIESGRISLGDQCWMEGWEEWRTVGEAFGAHRAQHFDPNSWKIFYRKRKQPPPLSEITVADIEEAKRRVPSFGLLDVVFSWYAGASALIVFLLFAPATFFFLIYLSESFAIGFFGTFVLCLLPVVACVAFGVSCRKSQFNSALKSVVDSRIRQQLNNFEAQEIAKCSSAEIDGIYCREVVTIEAPKRNESLLEALKESEQLVTRAEVLFDESAFTPFWDTVDQTVRSLRGYEDALGGIRDLALSYYGLLEGREHNFPEFPVDRDSIPDATPVFNRLEAVIARAHRDFQFTQIYEQRKTTSAVVAGFRSLNHAITHLREDIVSSLNGLRRSVDVGFHSVGERIESFEARQNRNAELLRETLDSQHRENLNSQDENHERLRDSLDKQHREDRAAYEKVTERDKRFQQQTDESLRKIEKNSDPDRHS